MSDVTTHADLLRALAGIRVELETRAEDLADLVSRVNLLADRTLHVADHLSGLDVDPLTTDEIREVAAALTGQRVAARAYQVAAAESEGQAKQAAVMAHRKHGGIAEAVSAAPVHMAGSSFYTED